MIGSQATPPINNKVTQDKQLERGNEKERQKRAHEQQQIFKTVTFLDTDIKTKFACRIRTTNNLRHLILLTSQNIIIAE